MMRIKELSFASIPFLRFLIIALILAGGVNSGHLPQETRGSHDLKTVQPNHEAFRIGILPRTAFGSFAEVAVLAMLQKRSGSDVIRVASVSKIEISPRTHSLNPCEKKRFSASVKDSGNKRIKDAGVTWRSSNPKVAEIDKNGVAVGVSPGYTFIQAINGNVRSNSVSLFVRDKQVNRSC